MQDSGEIVQLQKWLDRNKSATSIAGIAYLIDILRRVNADGVIDQDEQRELHLAIERVIPKAMRGEAERNRKAVDKAQREREWAIERERRDRELAQARREADQFEHIISKVVGVTYPNDDGTERQDVIARCNEGEQLILQHDKENRFSEVATKVLRTTGEQLGHLPDSIAWDLYDTLHENAGWSVMGVTLNLTGGTPEKPTRGCNILLVLFAEGTTNEELNAYLSRVITSVR